MRNNEISIYKTDPDALAVLLADIKTEEYKAHALGFSSRLQALALYITYEGLNGDEAAELLRDEATRVEHDSQEQH